jgi:hypothetical protein
LKKGDMVRAAKTPVRYIYRKSVVRRSAMTEK